MRRIWEGVLRRWDAASPLGRAWAAVMLATVAWWIYTGRPEAWTLAILYLVILAQAAEVNLQDRTLRESRGFTRMGREVTRMLEEVQEGDSLHDMVVIRVNSKNNWVMEKW